MATTSPDNLRTPNPGDSYNLVPDLATLAEDVQSALNLRNTRSGTAAQRTTFLATATPGMLWQDTDGIGMLWKRGASAWVPAVWRWSGTTAQMNAFTQAPNGFEWFNTTTSSTHIRLAGVWRLTHASGTSLTAVIQSQGVQNITVTYPAGAFPSLPAVQAIASSGRLTVGYASPTATGFVISVNNWSPAAAGAAEISWIATLRP